ncbi:MAG: replicative DNA helicase [Alphaproteobacteria bacterium]
MGNVISNVIPLQNKGQNNGQQGTKLTVETTESKPIDYRELPHNVEIEMVLLGAILRNNRALETIGEQLKLEHFYVKEHQIIYSHILKVVSKGQIASPTTLAHIIDNDPLLKEAGGKDYLYGLVSNLMSVINVDQYANQLQDLYMRRELTNIGEGVVLAAQDLGDHDHDGHKLIEMAEHQLYNLATTGESDNSLTSLGNAGRMALDEIAAAHERGSKLVGVTTGIDGIDKTLGGLHRSDLIILAGRPGMGKTALATNMAFNAANAYRIYTDDQGKEHSEGGKVLYFSLEMSATQLAGRILAERSQVSGDRMRRGDIQADDLTRIGAQAARLAEIPLYIDDTPALSITGVRQRARRVQRQFGLGMIVIDYLQLLNPPPDRRSENRVQEVSEITRGLKALARELSVPVIALSQLSRMVEQREDNRPVLSDLRESGSIEQDADVVAFIYREEQYLKRKQATQRANERDENFKKREAELSQQKLDAMNKAEFIIEKQRHGPTGTVPLFFDKDYSRFTDLDKRYDQQD